jgi:hypothetical protein
MKDFKVISAKTVLTVSAVAPVRGFQPPSIAVRGVNLNLATEVYYNGILASEFVVAAQDRLIVKIPKSEVGHMLTSLKVLSDAVLTKSDGLISLSLPNPLNFITGVERLVQTFILIFLTTPGSDIFEPNSGGGGYTIVGKNTNQRGKGVAADLMLAIERTRDEILQFQANEPNLSLSEKLLSADIQSVNFNPDETALVGRVGLTNMLGDQAEVSIG